MELIVIKTAGIDFILSKQNTHWKNDVKNFFMGGKLGFLKMYRFNHREVAWNFLYCSYYKDVFIQL